MNIPHDLLHLYREKSDAFRREHNRLLPLTEMVVDRWTKAEILGFGPGTSIHDNSFVYGDVQVGENTWIGPYTILDGHNACLTIGNNCSISAGVQIYTHDSVKWAVTGGAAKYEYASTTIADNVYIGPQTIVTKGVTVGEHSIVGAGSLVNKDLPPYSMAYGYPARVMGTVIFNEERTDFTIDYLQDD